MTTTLTLFGQAAARIEKDGRRLAFDPGALSDPAVLEGADAVLLTHSHSDHVVPADLARALEGTDAPVWAPADLAADLRDAGLGAARVHVAGPGDAIDAAGFDVRVLGGQHAVIHPELPHPENLAYLVDGALLHPGDSFVVPEDGVAVDVLLLPVSAPWMKLSEAAEHVRAVAPRVAVPIHDAILSDAGRGIVDKLLRQLVLDGTEYRRLDPGEALEV